MQHFLKNKNGDFKQISHIIYLNKIFFAFYKTKMQNYKTRRKSSLKKHTHISLFLSKYKFTNLIHNLFTYLHLFCVVLDYA